MGGSFLRTARFLIQDYHSIGLPRVEGERERERERERCMHMLSCDMLRCFMLYRYIDMSLYVFMRTYRISIDLYIYLSRSLHLYFDTYVHMYMCV